MHRACTIVVETLEVLAQAAVAGADHEGAGHDLAASGS